MLSASVITKSSNTPNSKGLASNSLIRKFSLFAILVSLVTGCASAGPDVYNVPKYNVPKTPHVQDQARIIVNRNTDFLYLALSARVFVDGRQIGELSRGETISTDVNPGRVTVTTDTAISSGRYSVSLNAEQNAEYQFEVSPFGALGSAAAGSANKNNGLFKIRGIGFKTYGPAQTTTPETTRPIQKLIIQAHPPAAVKPVTSSAKERLLELKKLLDDGLINQEDYDRKKRQILKDI